MPDKRKTKAQLIAELQILRQRAVEYRALFEDNPQPMWVYNLASLAFLAVNDAAVGHYGYSRAEFQSMILESVYGHGTTVRVLLPICVEAERSDKLNFLA